jgi:hypothetical protein
MKTLLFAGSFLGIMLSAQAQVITVFQPGPGNNDGTDDGGINGGKDVICSQETPSTNYGSYPQIYTAPISNCNSTHVISMVKFDVSTLPENADSVFVGFTHLDHTSYCYSNCNADFYFAYMLADWNESTVTYNDFPSQGLDFFGPINISFPNAFGLREYNITSAYNAWRSGATPNHGFIIYSPTVGCNNASVIFYVHASDASDSTQRPYLKVYGGNVGLPENSNSISTRVFPNPSNDNCTLQMDAKENDLVNIYLSDMQGKLVKTIAQEQIPAGRKSIQFSVSDLEAGTYFITIEGKNGTSREKLMVF